MFLLYSDVSVHTGLVDTRIIRGYDDLYEKPIIIIRKNYHTSVVLIFKSAYACARSIRVYMCATSPFKR